MLLVVNIGNSNIRFGVFKTNLLECESSWIIKSKPSRSESLYVSLFKESYKANKFNFLEVTDIVIGSVVPSLTGRIFNALQEIHKRSPLIVDRHSKSSIRHASHQLGTDLYANVVAAHNHYKKTSLIIDFGTALTLSAVGKGGDFLGVIIAPGIESSLDGLVKSTAQLQPIELEEPLNVLGKHTKECMQSGMIYGYVSMIEGLISRVEKELNQKCFIIITGGLSDIYGPLLKGVNSIDKLHTIKGIGILHRLTKR